MQNSILELDIGNTRTKWRIFGGASQCIFNNDMESLKEFDQLHPSRVRISCVANDEVKNNIVHILEKKFSCSLSFAAAQSSCAGLKNKYQNPEVLGVDRWLACLAAWHHAEKNAVLVIDAGSALTIDVVNDRSELEGGYILPGLLMMQQSLVGNTGKINCSVDQKFRKDFAVVPTCTSDAVQKGASLAAVATIEKMASFFLRQWPSGRIYLTGGGGADIAGILECGGIYKPDLVLDGLAMALP